LRLLPGLRPVRRHGMRVRVRGLTALRHHQPARLVVAQGPDSPARREEITVTREQALKEAVEAAAKAQKLAAEAERSAHSFESHPKVARYAAAGATWADTARSWAAIAAVLPGTGAEEEG